MEEGQLAGCEVFLPDHALLPGPMSACVHMCVCVWLADVSVDDLHFVLFSPFFTLASHFRFS